MESGKRTPEAVTVCISGVEYELDLETVHHALATWRRRSDVGLAPVQALAAATELSRCTVWRFTSGRPIGLGATRRITKVLGLKLEDVLTPVRRSHSPATCRCRATADAATEAQSAALAWLHALEGWMAEVSALVDRLRQSAEAGATGIPTPCPPGGTRTEGSAPDQGASGPGTASR